MELLYDLIEEILIWVPVKYVLRCRCVSKGWCSVIDSTKFVVRYSKVSSETNRVGLIIQGSYEVRKKYLLSDFESFDDASEVIDLSEEVGGMVVCANIVGLANGLVCLKCLSMVDDGMDFICLLNPCTRKCKKLPVAGNEFLVNNNLLKYFGGGFGYDRVSDDYKVVMMARCNLPTGGIMVIMYSLKRNSWTPIADVFSIENIEFFDTWGTFAYGVVQWKVVNVTSGQFFIVGFDLGLKRFTEPRCCHGNFKLSDISIEKSHAEEMWANPVFRSFRSVKPLMYSKDLEKILLEVGHERFMWYDFRSKAFKNVTVPGIPNRFVSYRYIESLFPLIEDRQPSDDGKQKKQQPKKRFLTIVLVLGSVVGSLMLFSRSRRGT